MKMYILRSPIWVLYTLDSVEYIKLEPKSIVCHLEKSCADHVRRRDKLEIPYHILLTEMGIMYSWYNDDANHLMVEL